jgi:hypothetical protein
MQSQSHLLRITGGLHEDCLGDSFQEYYREDESLEVEHPASHERC